MLRSSVVRALLALLSLSSVAVAMTPEERKQYREQLLGILPDVPQFKAWVEKTNAIPPDFDALPRHNPLPEPLRFLDGREVKSVTDWSARRQEIRRGFEEYMLGKIPPKPALENVVVLEETKSEGYLERNVRLEFGPEKKGTLRVRVVIPEGAGPFPVLIAPNLNGWATTLLPRGYISCGYAGSDGADDANTYAALYPDYDFAALPRRAFAAQLAVDYLYSLPQVDKQKIAITGYSRDGKMATIAAALDERITALIAGSTGVGGVTPWRLAGERTMGESIESTTRMFPTWYAPQFRWFSGREDRLPVDCNLLLALVAPRPCLMQYGLNDEVANPWSNEQSFHSAMKVYNLFQKPSALGILRNPGFHSTGINQNVALDWLDIQWGRSNKTWHNDFLFAWDYQEWVKRSGEKADLAKMSQAGLNNILKNSDGTTVGSREQWEQKSENVRKNVNWVLGDHPVRMAAGRGPGRGGLVGGRGPIPRGLRGNPAAAAPNPAQLKPDVPKWVIGRNIAEFGWRDPERSTVTSRQIRFGDGVVGDLYTPVSAPEGAKLPVVIWLHGYSYPIGYMWVYRQDTHPVLALAQAGYAVLAFDQSGFGSRMEEAGPFYDRTPHWSRLGRMVDDVRAAIDVVQQDSALDGSQIWLFGYSLGGNVALHTAALDKRVTGVAVSCAFTPYRTDTDVSMTGGLARYSAEIGLAPRLGLFIGHEDRVPYDYHELIAMVAPRPVFIHSPLMNREARREDVKQAVAQAQLVYGLYDATEKLVLKQPWDYHRLPASAADEMIQWMKSQRP